MPLKIIHKAVDGCIKYAVKNMETGKTHGFTTKEKAEAQMRLLNAIDHGYLPPAGRK
jgi:hypothetical protein